MHELRGVGVLVTRPAEQAPPLCRLLEARGASSHRFAVLGIEPVELAPTAASGSGQADLLIFTSSNAVRCGRPLLEIHPHAALAAIGPATARALELAANRPILTPPAPFDSEALLRHAALAHPARHTIVIVTGRHGRELLRDELRRRGAEVTIAEVYERRRIVHDRAVLDALAARFAVGDIQVVTATSAQIGLCLAELDHPELERALRTVPWLVPNARVGMALREGGVNAPMLQADSAEDQDLVCALVRWRSSVSAA